MEIDPLEAAKGNWRLLLQSLGKLAGPGEEQIGDPELDEAFGWEGSYLPSWQSDERGWISPELRSKLDFLEELLDKASSDTEYWTDDAVVNSDLWNEIRSVAQASLALIPDHTPWHE